MVFLGQNMNINGITILQSVYYKDNHEHLDLCLQSLYQQTIKINRIVIVKDGKIPDELENVLIKWQSLLPLFVVGYSENKGLAYALNYGLQFCETEFVARMDSDDICYNDRFEKQINFMIDNPDIVLTSSFAEEFYINPNEIDSIKKIPLNYSNIQEYIKTRNPFNHMSVFFKKSAIIDVGGYSPVPFFEDYDLWIRLIQKGYKAKNMSECLVKARIGNDMIGRRHGFAYAKHEFNFIMRQYSTGFINMFEFIKIILLRIPLRLLPKPLLRIIYKIIRR